MTYNPEFLAWYFRSPRFRQLMSSEVTGIGGFLTRAQPKRVAEYPVPDIVREKQDKIVEVLNKGRDIIDRQNEKLKKFDALIKSRFATQTSLNETQQLFDSLMQKYFQLYGWMF